MVKPLIGLLYLWNEERKAQYEDYTVLFDESENVIYKDITSVQLFQ